MGQADGPLLVVLASAVERQVNHFLPQELANTTWAFAKVGQADAQLLSVLAKAAECYMGDFNAQGLANLA